MNLEQFALRKCRQNGLLIDTNLLIVFLFGLYDPKFIELNSKTAGYTEQDFGFILSLVNQSVKVIVTPQILAEVSNMTFDKTIAEPGFTHYFAQTIQVLEKAEENHTHMDIFLKSPRVLASIGFADMSIMEAAKELDCVVLTADGPLTGWLQSSGCTVLNLNHLRGQAWLGTFLK